MDSSRKFDGEVEAEIRDSRHHQQDKENRMVKRAAAVPFYRDPLDLTIIAAGCISLIFMTMAFIVYNRKKKLRSSYEDFPDRKEEQKRSSSCSQASIYGGASQTKSIEFVVPNLPGALSTALSPGEKISTSSQNVPLLCHVSLLDGASSFTSILGGLNPELYKETPTEQDDDEEYPEDNIGRLWFSIKYDAASERLAIKLIKAKNLPSRVHGTINSCDPFVRIFLIPDERRYLQSKIKKKTCNPNFDEEIFVFQIPMKAMEDYSLRLTVYDSERSKRQKIIGHVFFPLKDVQSTSNLMIWRDLSKDEEEEPSEHAQLLVSLCYNQKIERLTVNVFEAKNISIPEGSNCDTYAKVSLLMETKVVKTKKTAVAKKTIEPKYNEPFHFALPIGAAGTASVTIQLCVAGGIQKEKCVGRLVLGSPMFARGKANEHWDEAMATNHRQVRYWHKLT